MSSSGGAVLRFLRCLSVDGWPGPTVEEMDAVGAGPCRGGRALRVSLWRDRRREDGRGQTHLLWRTRPAAHSRPSAPPTTCPCPFPAPAPHRRQRRRAKTRGRRPSPASRVGGGRAGGARALRACQPARAPRTTTTSLRARTGGRRRVAVKGAGGRSCALLRRAVGLVGEGWPGGGEGRGHGRQELRAAEAATRRSVVQPTRDACPSPARGTGARFTPYSRTSASVASSVEGEYLNSTPLRPAAQVPARAPRRTPARPGHPRAQAHPRPGPRTRRCPAQRRARAGRRALRRGLLGRPGRVGGATRAGGSA